MVSIGSNGQDSQLLRRFYPKIHTDKIMQSWSNLWSGSWLNSAHRPKSNSKSINNSTFGFIVTLLINALHHVGPRIPFYGTALHLSLHLVFNTVTTLHFGVDSTYSTRLHLEIYFRIHTSMQWCNSSILEYYTLRKINPSHKMRDHSILLTHWAVGTGYVLSYYVCLPFFLSEPSLIRKLCVGHQRP